MKTIEEVAVSYATEVDKNVKELYGIENPPISITFGECAAKAFRAGANHLMSLPLVDRLTNEERDKIKKLYESYVDSMEFHYSKYLSALNKVCRTASESNYYQYKSKIKTLETIFGKEMLV